MHYAQAGFFGSADLSSRGREAFRPNHLAGLTMKRLLVGTALGVLILLGSAGWAQTPISPGGALGPRPAPAQPTTAQKPSINMPQATPAPASSSEADERETPPRASRHRRGGRSGRHAARPGSSPADYMADQLNRQELQRLPPAAPVAPVGPAGLPPGRPAR